ncbi:MAG: hydroxymethylbilane synthase, partial [Actinomycetes bacterium]
MRRVLRLGTRASALATAQSAQVAQRLQVATGRSVQLVTVTTAGDTSAEPLARIGGSGVFVGALRQALLDDQVDLAVHSLKDLPTAPADGIHLAAVPVRADPRDALVAGGARRLDQLRSGATVGTGSLRRAAQLRAWAREHGRTLDVVDLRGNVDTRLRRVADGSLDAVVLAGAGLGRLG